MASKTPTWVWVVLGIVGFGVLSVVVLIGGSVVMVRRHVHTEFAEKQTADQEFARQRARFAGQQPLVELRKTANVDDNREGRLIHIDVPLWLMRMMPASNGGTRGRRMTLRGNNLDFDFESGDLTLEDVERHGPGLVVDGVDSRGAQVLVWAE